MNCTLTPQDQLDGFSGVAGINGHCWKIRYTPEGNYIGVCDELGVTMQGDTEGDLFANIVHTIHLIKEDEKNP